MNKVYDYNTGKVVEVVLDKGEQEYLARYNLAAIAAYNKEAKELRECINYANEEEDEQEIGC